MELADQSWLHTRYAGIIGFIHIITGASDSGKKGYN